MECSVNIAHYKRLKEYLIADPEFEKAFCMNAEKTLQQYKLDLDADLLRPLWDKEYAQKLAENKAIHPLSEIEQHLQTQWKDSILLNYLQDGSIKQPQYRAWRQRQKARTKSLFHKLVDDQLVHSPLAFELSKGCSMQCPFCGLAPSPLEKIFSYSEEHAKLWQEVLHITQEIFGPAAGTALCYWATEPFDNPDYEKFCLDFAAINGYFPHTTTVKHLNDLERIRRFLRLSEEHGGRQFHRFSITSLSMLRKIYKAFSPEELLPIQLVLNNKESKALYCNSGRARDLYARTKHKEKFYPEGSSACVSGFLLNMPDQTIQLITPCNPSDTWPLGYMVYEYARFTTATEYASIITGMIEKYMPLSPRPTDRIRFRPELQFDSFDNGFSVSTRFMKRTFRHDPILKELGMLIQKGDYTLQELQDMFELCFLSANSIVDAIQKMFNAGILDELALIAGNSGSQ
jgi:radical SAM family RiPP maturation amino acid epimerase